MKPVFEMILLLAVALHSAHATTWFDDEATDPITGESITVQSIGSYGSYIYEWDSKFDAVYWPLTTESFIYFNTNSGYIAFGADFEEISTNDIQQVKAFLDQNYDPAHPPKSHIEKLQWLEQVYSHRKTDDTFEIRYYGLMSYLHRQDKETANTYRKIALEKIRVYLKTAKPSFYRSQLYGVAGFYSKLLGQNDDAELFWSSPERLNFDDETTEAAKAYLDRILNSIQSDQFQAGYFGLKQGN